MSLNSLTIKADATISVANGTDVVFEPDSVEINGGIHLSVPADSYTGRRQLTLKAKPAIVNVSGEWTKDKKSASLVLPVTVSSGKTVFNVVRMETEFHPEIMGSTDADYRKQATQLLISAAMANFWSNGSLS